MKPKRIQACFLILFLFQFFGEPSAFAESKDDLIRQYQEVSRRHRHAEGDTGSVLAQALVIAELSQKLLVLGLTEEDLQKLETQVEEAIHVDAAVVEESAVIQAKIEFIREFPRKRTADELKAAFADHPDFLKEVEAITPVSSSCEITYKRLVTAFLLLREADRFRESPAKVEYKIEATKAAVRSFNDLIEDLHARMGRWEILSYLESAAMAGHMVDDKELLHRFYLAWSSQTASIPRVWWRINGEMMKRVYLTVKAPAMIYVFLAFFYVTLWKEVSLYVEQKRIDEVNLVGLLCMNFLWRIMKHSAFAREFPRRVDFHQRRLGLFFFRKMGKLRFKGSCELALSGWYQTDLVGPR